MLLSCIYRKTIKAHKRNANPALISTPEKWGVENKMIFVIIRKQTR